MIRLSSCIEMMFGELPFVQRIEAAKTTGFQAWEMWNWANRDLPALEEAMGKAGLPAAACCVGSRDPLVVSGMKHANMLDARNARMFAEMVEETITAVDCLRIKTLIATTGNTLPDVPREQQQEAIVSCLSAAAPILAKHGCVIVLEPLNILVNHAGYYLSTSGQGFEILNQVGSPHVKLLYDVYHQQITEGNLIDAIRANIRAIGHFHIADVPGRFEPGTGEINYGNVFTAISASGYDGYVGCEYAPSNGKSTAESARLVLELANRQS